MGSWSKLIALSPREQWLLVQALVALPVSGVALRFIALRRWQLILERLAPAGRAMSRPRDDQAVEAGDRTARMVRIAASRGFHGGNCLRRSLTLWWLLRRQGLDSVIRFGARRDGGRFHAHAWVEFRGAALDDGSGAGQDFAAFERAMTPMETKAR